MSLPSGRGAARARLPLGRILGAPTVELGGGLIGCSNGQKPFLAEWRGGHDDAPGDLPSTVDLCVSANRKTEQGESRFGFVQGSLIAAVYSPLGF